jgi:phage terminase large subunit-like protein
LPARRSKLPKFDKFVKDTISGKRIVGDLIVAAAKRHQDDIKKSRKKDYPYYFDYDRAKEHVEFCQRMRLIQGDAADKFWSLDDWQVFLVGSIHGWREKATDKRRFSRAYIQIPKKNGKTTLGAGMCLDFLYMSHERNGQYYFAAYTREQANIGFDFCQKMALELVEDWGDVEEVTRIPANSIVRLDNHSYIRSVSSEAKNTEGRGGYFILLDEYHVHPNDKLRNSLQSGQKVKYSDRNMLMIITTAGDSVGGPCHRYYDNVARKVVEGIVENDRLFVMIADCKNEDWDIIENSYAKNFKDKKWVKVLQKSNLSLGSAVRIEDLKEDIIEAIQMGGSKINDFKTKHMNIWVNQSAEWISDQLYMEGAKAKFKEEDTYDGVCNVGVDLAKTTDICTVIQNITLTDSKGEEMHYVIPHFYITEKKLQKGETDGVDYAKFVMEGHMTVAGEESVDDTIIEEKILEIIEKWNVNSIKYDPAMTNRLIDSLKGKTTVNISKLSQSWESVSPPTRLLERIIREKKVRHNGHPVMRWMMSNVNIKTKGEYIRINKSSADGKVDGPAAWAFSLGGLMFDTEEEKESPTVITL